MWPSGIVQNLTDVATDQVITVIESTIQREHDIAVTSIDAPNYAEPNSTILINSTISNLGLSNESTINVDFLVDGVTKNNTTIPFIESGNSTNVSFQWTAPNVTGIYNITIYVEPVVNETTVWNNQLSTSISVIMLPVHNLDTGENFSTIQAAIDDSDTNDGHTITVDPGTYNENVVVNKGVTLRGIGMPVVDAGGSSSAIKLSADEITLERFKLTNSRSWWADAGIKVTSNDNTITGNTASDNGHGIYLGSSNNNTITDNIASNNNYYGTGLSCCNNNTITGNIASNDSYGIHIDSSSNNSITSNTASNNKYHGIRFSSSNNSIIAGNNASNNRDGIGLFQSSNNNTITDNNAINNGCGIEFFQSSNNTITKNTASGNTYRGITLRNYCNNNTITSNNASNNSNYGGIELGTYCNNNTITGNNANNNGHGIFLYKSTNNTITNNNASNSNNDYGIGLCRCNNNTITGNTANNNGQGIYLEVSSNNSITGNTVCNNSDGIELLLLNKNNDINCNWVAHNEQRGFYLWWGGNTGNTIKDNNIMSNGVAAEGSWHYNFYNDQSNYVTAENNYWGTDNSTIIAESIYDSSDDPSLGTVDFEPFRTEPAPCAPFENKLYIIQAQTDKPTYTLNENVTISCTVQNETGCNITADSVDAEILKPDSSIEWITMAEELVGHYNGTFTNTSLNGTYNVTIYANKAGYVNDTAELSFEVSTLSVHNINTGEDFARIQAAIDDSDTQDGHVITVDPGTYNENVNVNKQLTIRSISGNPTDTILQAANPTDHVFEVTADSVNISGFTVESATGDLKAGIYLGSADHCNISGNTANLNSYGISLWQSSNNTLENNTANSNNYAGIHLYFSSNTTLTNSIILNNVVGIGLDSSSNNTIISNNISYNGDGIFSFDLSANDLSSNNNILGNTISNNGRGILLIITSSNNIIINNTISNNDEGIIFESASNNNTITNNTVNSNNNYGIYLKDSSNNLIFHNNLVNNTNNANDTNPTNNDWHHPALLEGNYWSDYAGLDDGTGTGKHAIAGDGIGDTNISHPAEDYDFYPFMTESLWTNTKMSVETATGTGSATLSTNRGYFSYVSAVNETSLPSEGKPNRQFPHGFFSFNITGLTTGQTVDVTITLPSEMPTTTQYWKYHTPEGWYQIPVYSNDGDNIITIQLTDGGTGDDDGIANGMIVDPGAPALPPPAKPDLEITDKCETWLEDGNFTVTYTVKNTGDANAGASDTTIFIDGVDALEDPVPVLAPGATYKNTVGPFYCTCDHTLNVTVCADNADIVDESNEINNCLENELACPPCVIQSYGNSISIKRNVRVAWRALGEPDRRGALMFWNARIAIELNETIPECEKVSVWVRRVAVRAPAFDVGVSPDAKKWTKIGSATCYSWRWQRFEFTNDSGDWKDIKYIGIRKPGGTWRPKLMGLDAVCAEGRG